MHNGDKKTDNRSPVCSTSRYQNLLNIRQCLQLRVSKRERAWCLQPLVKDIILTALTIFDQRRMNIPHSCQGSQIIKLQVRDIALSYCEQ
jgi:hypothetical protein